MSLGTNIIAESRKMALPERGADNFENHPNAIAGIHILSSALKQIEAKVEVQDRDKYSLLINQITISRNPRSSGKQTAQTLRRQSLAIAKKVTYLLEDFDLTEIDEKNRVAQIRSSSPHRQTGEVFYYEILLYGDHLIFNRYRKEKGATVREKVASHLSNEVVQRLIDDLAEVLGGDEIECEK